MADGFGKYTGARSLPLCVRVVCLGDAVKVVVTERGLAGEQGHPGSPKWSVVLQTNYSVSL